MIKCASLSVVPIFMRVLEHVLGLVLGQVAAHLHVKHFLPAVKKPRAVYCIFVALRQVYAGMDSLFAMTVEAKNMVTWPITPACFAAYRHEGHSL